MLKHHVKTSIRGFSRNKFYSTINILGLSIGMGVCLVIFQYIHFEKSFDRFHENAQSIYRLTLINSNKEGLKPGASTPHALGPNGAESISEIESYCRTSFVPGSTIVINPEKKESFREDRLLFTDNNFLEFFDFGLKYGDKELALDDQSGIVITEGMALKYFGAENPLGKTLRVIVSNEEKDYFISAVLAKLPSNSHLQFDFLLPIELQLAKEPYNSHIGSWGYLEFTTYVKLKDDVEHTFVGERLDQLFITHIGELLDRFNTKFQTGFQPIADIHLKSDYRNDQATSNGSISDVNLFSFIAIAILALAWVNYVNLATARSIQRTKEIGIRKSVGALRKQLVLQFITEAVLTNVVSAILAIGIATLLLPILNNIIGYELEFVVLLNSEFWIAFLTIVLFGSVISGFYPALVLSSAKPISMLKSTRNTSNRNPIFKKGLIVFQFLASILLLTATYLAYRQITFMKSYDLGVDMQKILVVNGPASQFKDGNARMQTFKNNITNHHSILSVSGSGSVPGSGFDFGTEIHKLGESIETRRPAYFISVDHDFNKNYDFDFLSGRFFSKEISTDEQGVIINEEAVKVFELGNAQEALDKKLIVKGERNDTVRVVGVLKNFHWVSLKSAHSPYVIALAPESNNFYSIKISSNNIPETLLHIEAAYTSSFPNNPINFFFLDDNFNNQYQSDLKFRNLFASFSILAIFIACLGLFALVSHSASVRAKEMGIRKVLGAPLNSLLILLSREFMVLFMISIVIALPIIVYYGGNWLDGYAFRIRMGVEFIIVPALALFAFSLLIVCYRTYVTARANPVDSLKVE